MFFSLETHQTKKVAVPKRSTNNDVTHEIVRVRLKKSARASSIYKDYIMRKSASQARRIGGFDKLDKQQIIVTARREIKES